MGVLIVTMMAQAAPPEVRPIYDTIVALGLVAAGVALVVLAVFRIGHLRGERNEFSFKDLVRLAADPFGLVALIGAALIASGVYVSQRDYKDVLGRLETLNAQLQQKVEEVDLSLAQGRKEVSDVKHTLEEAIEAIGSMSMQVVLDFGSEAPPDFRDVKVTAHVRGEGAEEAVPRTVGAEPAGGGIIVRVTDLHPGDSLWLTAEADDRRWRTATAIKVPVIALEMEPVRQGAAASLQVPGQASAMGGAR